MNVPAHPSYAFSGRPAQSRRHTRGPGPVEFRSDPLREHLREVFQSAPGTATPSSLTPSSRPPLAGALRR